MASIRSAIAMTGPEIEAFVRDRRTAILATIGPGGQPHLAAMWFALVDGSIVFEAKGKSQKVVNVRRNPHHGPADGADNAALDQVMYNRVALVLRPDRPRSWDHRKLGLDLTAPPAGSSAAGIRGWEPARPAPA